MMDLSKVNEAIHKHMRPQTYPLAIRMLEPGEEVPQRAKTLKKDMGIKAPLCNAFALARRWGWSMIADKEQSCWLAGICMGMLPIKPDVADGSFQAEHGVWGLNQEESVEFLHSYYKLDYGKYDRVLVCPIEKAQFEPHVILLYGSPAQIWLMAVAYMFPKRMWFMDVALSVGAGCITAIAKTMTTDSIQFSIVGAGERYNNAQDHECALSIPASKVDDVINGLDFVTKKPAFRYPIHAYLKYNAEHPPGYDEMLEHLSE